MICKTNVTLHISISSFPLLTGLSSSYVHKYSPADVKLSLCKTRRRVGNQVTAPLIRNLQNTSDAESVESSVLTYWSLDRQDVIPTAWTPWDAMDPSEKRKSLAPAEKPRFLGSRGRRPIRILTWVILAPTIKGFFLTILRIMLNRMENIGAYISWFLRYLKTPYQLPTPGSRKQVIVKWLWKEKGCFVGG